ncbi:MAG: hypothetical protein PF501_16330 [Salinisphaera sp.]|jgi:hypothetical protein|nr:hypothetical protein [Salinisphaera sp.]
MQHKRVLAVAGGQAHIIDQDQRNPDHRLSAEVIFTLLAFARLPQFS